MRIRLLSIDFRADQPTRTFVPFLAGLVLCAALLFAFPQLATLLPGLLMK